MTESPNITRHYFAAAVRARRQESRLSQEQLASKAGVSHVTVNHVELGKVLPDLSTLEKLAHALDCDIAILYNEGRLLARADSLATRERVSNAVKALRDSRGWSQRDLADKSGLSSATVSNIERCKKAATIDALHQISCAFDVDVLDLFQNL